MFSNKYLRTFKFAYDFTHRVDFFNEHKSEIHNMFQEILSNEMHKPVPFADTVKKFTPTDHFGEIRDLKMEANLILIINSIYSDFNHQPFNAYQIWIRRRMFKYTIENLKTMEHALWCLIQNGVVEVIQTEGFTVVYEQIRPTKYLKSVKRTTSDFKKAADMVKLSNKLKNQGTTYKVTKVFKKKYRAKRD